MLRVGNDARPFSNPRKRLFTTAAAISNHGRRGILTHGSLTVRNDGVPDSSARGVRAIAHHGPEALQMVDGQMIEAPAPSITSVTTGEAARRSASLVSVAKCKIVRWNRSF
jgi:hypothetical protein